MVYKEKKCFLQKLYIIVLLLFVPLFIVLNTTSCLALTKDYSSFKLRLLYRNASGYVLTNDLLYNQVVTDVDKVDAIRVQVDNIGTLPSNTEYISVSGKFNLVAECAVSDTSDRQNTLCPRNTGEPPYILATNLNGTSTTFISDTLNVYVTDWFSTLQNTQPLVRLFRTFTYEFSFIINNNIPSSVTSLAFSLQYDGALDNAINNQQTYYFQPADNNRMSIDFTTDKNTALLQQQIQIQQLQVESSQQINNTLQQQFEQENQSIDNISGQSVSDIPDSSDSQTTSIIGTINSFVTALGTIQAGSCELTLPFPQFLGGDTVVNPCNGKDKAPTIVTVGSSMFLIGVFIPFAFIVLKMIYNEIRSFTNG